MRPLAIGRKNYMFCENHNAAEEEAIMYTMMGCCKLADVDFRKCTTYFLQHVHEYDDKRPYGLFPSHFEEEGLSLIFFEKLGKFCKTTLKNSENLVELFKISQGFQRLCKTGFTDGLHNS